MLLNDFFQHLWRARVIPDAFRIDDRNRTVQTHAEAIRLGAENAGILGGGKAEFFEPIFEKFPGGKAGSHRAALGVRLICAEEDVALDFPDAERGGTVAEVSHGRIARLGGKKHTQQVAPSQFLAAFLMQ